ncbi:acyltransferase [[Clostridium] innocuum]|nr:acyltransferase [[Clostridium] innocuum]MCR0575993.1 acyltransferase [[Clostridium] innocuum]
MVIIQHGYGKFLFFPYATLCAVIWNNFGMEYEKMDFNFIKTKIRLLLYPMFIWSILLYFVQDFPFTGLKPFIVFPETFLDYLKLELIHPNYIIWFLYDIFVFTVVIFICEKLNDKFKVQSISLYCLILFVFCVYPTEIFGWSRFKMYFAFFFMGYYIGKYKWNYKLVQGNGFTLLLLSLLQLLLIKYYYNQYSAVYQWIVGFNGILIVTMIVNRILCKH